MLLSLIRAFIIYTLVVVVMRIMGKRQVAQLQPFELVIALMIADLATIPMEDTSKPLLSGLIPIAALLLAGLILSYITLKSERIRAFVCGSPSIIIENGRINLDELKKQRINLNDLLEQLRSKDISNISDVEFAILETGGQLNVIPKSQKRPLTPKDLNIQTPYEGIPYTLIMDGHIHHKNLTKAGKDIKWLSKQLAEKNLQPRDVLIASLDSNGSLEIQIRERGNK
ncbi:MAG TPA: DUF421 domain-containing protein [Clostridiales bacterium]|nr:DUF421 domain-containing protein [Clostridiales bacterium]